MKRLRFVPSLAAACALALLAGVSSGHAQNPKSDAARARAEQRKADREEAFAAFRDGDTARALAKLNAGVRRGPKDRRPELQLAEGLADIGTRLHNESHGARAREAALLAIGSLEQARGTVHGKEGAQAALLKGQLAQRILGDRQAARVAFEEALRHDPGFAAAREALDHINAVDARAAEKAAANELLRLRAQENR